MAEPWLSIVGVSEAGIQALGPHERAVVDSAATVIGPPRLLDGLGTTGQAVVPWEAPLQRMLEQVMRFEGTPTVVLATGDPSWFGIGATLSRHLRADAFAVHPAPSAFSLAAARMRWPLQHVSCLSLHGRPEELLHPNMLPGNRILALTTDRSTLPAVSEMLVERGYGNSLLTVLENLGGPDERIASAVAAQPWGDTVGDSYTLAIDCVADTMAPLLPPIPGLPDDAFLNDGQLTKREVRAATLARLAPYPGALLWDVGAGCGSIGIEWMRAARDARAIAFECEGERLQTISVNAANLGVPTLQMENGSAPGSFAGQPTPDAVFLGGDVSNAELFEAAWAALRPGGRFVANSVTLDGEAALLERQALLGGELVRIAVEILGEVGRHRVLRPRMPVLQWSATKASAG